MANGKSTIKSFGEYKKLTAEQKEFYTYEQLSKLDSFIMFAEKKFARKWVEKIFIVFISMVLIAFASVVIAKVIPT